jgi:hypothetical protein
MTMQQFLSEIQARSTMTLEFVERNCKGALENGHDWKISVGPRGDMYVVSVDSIKAYFDALNAPKPVAAPPTPIAKEFTDEPAIDERIKGAKSGGKREA